MATTGMNNSKSPFTACRRAILFKTQEMYTPGGETIDGIQPQIEVLLDDFRATIIEGESKSQLILGPRGSGKSLALRKTIEIIKKEAGENSFKVIELFSYMYEDNNYNSILKPLARQLGVQLNDWDHAVQTIKSFEVPLVVILKPMETFSEQNRPVLIYTLLDGMHNNKKGILVVGVTRRVDILETLERRVRSRFSQGHVLFLGYSDPVVLSSMKLPEIISQITTDAGDARKIQNLVILAMNKLSEKKLFLSIEDLETVANYMCRDKRAEMLNALPEETLGLLIATKKLIENKSNATGPVQLKLDQIIEHYYGFKKHSYDKDAKHKEIKEHYTDAVRHLAAIGLLHLHGPSPIIQPYSSFSARFDPSYLTSVVDSLDINTALKKWSKTWLE